MHLKKKNIFLEKRGNQSTVKLVSTVMEVLNYGLGIIFYFHSFKWY